MAGERTQLGEAVIKVSVDSAAVGPGMQQAQNEATAAASGSEKPIQDAAVATENLDKASSGAASSILNLRQAITVCVAASYGFISVVSKLIDSFLDLYKGSKQVNDELALNLTRGIDTIDGRVSALTAKSKELTDQFNIVNESGNVLALGMKGLSLAWNEGIYSAPQLAERIRTLNDEISKYNKLKADSNEDARIAAETKAYNERKAALANQMATEAEMNKYLAEKKAEDDMAAYQKMIEAKEYADAEAASKKRELADEQYERELRQAQTIADAVERAFVNAIQKTRDKSAGLFNVGEITNSIELIGQKLDAISRNTKSRM